MNLNYNVGFVLVFGIFSFLVLSLINCKNSRLEIKKNMYSNIFVLFILAVLGVLIYRNNKDFFTSHEACCEPMGITPINAPECTGKDNLPEDGVRKCGKVIKNGTARCMSEGQAFSCK